MTQPSHIATQIKALAQRLGFAACGFAPAAPVAQEAWAAYEQWIATGRNGCMAWAANYPELRRDPRGLLPGARTVVSLAVNYLPSKQQPASVPQIARYALGSDYHEVVRDRARELAQGITRLTGGDCRVCVDSAPILERYWAQRAGIGFVGRNTTLIIPGKGSFHFLCEVLTTAALPPDEPCRQGCGDCGACERACPGGALGGGVLDARRCLSCLTIECRDPQLPQWAEQALGNSVYGCDRCQLACPHNRQALPTAWPQFQAREALLSLTATGIAAMTQEQFSRIFTHSAVKRTKLAGLQRNAAHLLPGRSQCGEGSPDKP